MSDGYTRAAQVAAHGRREFRTNPATIGAVLVLLLSLSIAATFTSTVDGIQAHLAAGVSGSASADAPLPATGPGGPLPSAKFVNITLSSPKPGSSAEFGSSVALSGKIVAVGVSNGAVEGVDGGYVELFNRTTGALLLNLSSPNEVGGGHFGASVGISGGLVVVGAPDETANGLPDAGNAYTFDAKTGARIDTLSSPNAQGGGGFGYSVALANGILVVGAPSETNNGSLGAGHAYTFDAKSGTLIRTLASPLTEGDQQFGWSVAISEKVALVGAPLGANAAGKLGPGHAYTFNAKTGALLREFSSQHPRTDGFFGGSVAILDGIAVVGAPNENARGVEESGRAYLLNATTGDVIRSLTDPHAAPDGYFGGSVAMSGKNAIVGAQAYTGLGQEYAGYAYEFNTKHGGLIATLTSPDPQAGAGFGWSVAVSGGVVVVGAPYEYVDDLTQAGLAFIFVKS